MVGHARWYVPTTPQRSRRIGVIAREVTIERVCATYGVPMVPYESVVQYAAEFGDLNERA